MKKRASLMLASGLLLSGCGNGTTSGNGVNPYTITIKSMGYRVSGSTISITDAAVELYSAPGAPDVSTISYTAVMLNSRGELAGYNQSTVVPATGTLFGKAHGGYLCTTTATNVCTMMSSDVQLVTVGPAEAPENAITRSLMPREWAVIHNAASTAVGNTPPGGDTAGWYTQFTFTATQANGKKVTWKQNYAIIAPA